MKIEKEETVPLIERVLKEMYSLSKGKWVLIESNSIYKLAEKFELKPQFIPALFVFLEENKIFEFHAKRTRKSSVKTHYRSLDSSFLLGDICSGIFETQRRIQKFPVRYLENNKVFKDIEIRKLAPIVFNKKEQYQIDDVCYFLFVDGYSHCICQAEVFAVEKAKVGNFVHKVRFINPFSGAVTEKQVFDSKEPFQTSELLLNFLNENISKLK